MNIALVPTSQEDNDHYPTPEWVRNISMMPEEQWQVMSPAKPEAGPSAASMSSFVLVLLSKAHNVHSSCA